MKKFPQRRLHQNLEINSTVDEEDVLEVKEFLYKKGMYDLPDYGLTPYPDERLFESIKKYQKQHNLTVDGIMRVDGETQESMRKDGKIESEELPPPVQNIPGTNIPDRSIPEQGLEPESYDWYMDKINKYVGTIDSQILKSIPDPTMDPHIFIPPSDPKDPMAAPKQRSKKHPRGL